MSKRRSVMRSVLEGIASAVENNEKGLNRAASTGLKMLTTKIMSVLPDGIPDVERRRIEKQVYGDLSSAYDVVRIRITRKQSAPVPIDRLKVLAACDVLNVSRPKAGKPVDLVLAKTNQRAAVRAYHPDANGGNESTRNEFEAAVKAYEVLEAYNESLERAREPAKEPPITKE